MITPREISGRRCGLRGEIGTFCCRQFGVFANRQKQTKTWNFVEMEPEVSTMHGDDVRLKEREEGGKRPRFVGPLSLSKLKLKNGRTLRTDEILALSTVPHLYPYLYKQLVSRRLSERDTGSFECSSRFFRYTHSVRPEWSNNRNVKRGKTPGPFFTSLRKGIIFGNGIKMNFMNLLSII